jgi:hypothetical protein
MISGAHVGGNRREVDTILENVRDFNVVFCCASFNTEKQSSGLNVSMIKDDNVMFLDTATPSWTPQKIGHCDGAGPEDKRNCNGELREDSSDAGPCF